MNKEYTNHMNKEYTNHMNKEYKDNIRNIFTLIEITCQT